MIRYWRTPNTKNSRQQEETGVRSRPWRGAYARSFASRSASAICASSLIAPRQKSLRRIAARVSRFIATLPPQTIVNGKTPRGSAAMASFAAARQHELQRSSAGVIQR